MTDIETLNKIALYSALIAAGFTIVAIITRIIAMTATQVTQSSQSTTIKAVAKEEPKSEFKSILEIIEEGSRPSRVLED